MAKLSRILRADVRARAYYPAESNEPAQLSAEEVLRKLIGEMYNGVDGTGDQLHKLLHVTMPSEGYF